MGKTGDQRASCIGSPYCISRRVSSRTCVYKELWDIFRGTVPSCFNPEVRQTCGQKLKVGFRMTPSSRAGTMDTRGRF